MQFARRPELVEIDDTLRVEDEQGTVTWNDDGTIELEDGPAQPAPKSSPADHRANLAEHLSEDDLTKVAEDLLDAFEADKQAREPWERRLAKGMEVVGFVQRDDSESPFEGASSVVYPIIAEAVVQFNARALDELFPAAGPVKVVVVGDKTPEREAQAQRVQEYMNYQITEEDRGWQGEDDRMLMRLPLDGMAWKKVYRDERLGIQTSRFVPGHEVFAPESATATHTAPRICHRYLVSGNDLRFEQLSGNWLDLELHEPPGDDERERNEVEEIIEEAEGSEPTSYEKDRTHTILEFYVDYDLPGFEHVDDVTGEPTGFALPYVITVEENSRKVLKVVRNWKESDERYRKRINLIPYRFLEGMGFYGYGFLHTIGGLAEAATGALRALLDSAAWENMQGGFITKDLVGAKGGEMRLTMGAYLPIDATTEDLDKGIWSPPRHPPSEALFKCLSLLVDAGKSFTSTTEAMTGAAPSTGPVGTMVALIEQGSKVFSGIHKRLHKSKRDEYRLLAELNGEYVPEQGYPYDQERGGNHQIFAADFSEAVDVLPVSDPNIFSAQQRIAVAQALLQLAQESPDLYDVREAHRRMLEALKVPAIDDVLINQDQRPRYDPVTENMLMLNGRPVYAFPDQTHAAHMQVHQAFMMHPGYGGNPEAQQVMAQAMIAHMAQHLAYQYQQQMMAAAGLPYLQVDVAGQPHDDAAPPIPPQLQEEIAVRAAAASDMFLAGGGGIPGAQEQAQAAAQEQEAMAQQEAGQAQAEQEAAASQAQAEQQRTNAGFMAEEQRKQAGFEQEQRRREEEHAAELRQKEEAAKAAREPKGEK